MQAPACLPPRREEHGEAAVWNRPTRAELARWPKGDLEKVAMAWRLRQETTKTLDWIARRLQMGTWTYVSNCLTTMWRKCQSV